MKPSFVIPRLKRGCAHCDGTGHPIDQRALGRALRKMREQNGLSLREVARRLEVGPTYVSEVENAVGYAPRADFVRRYVKALG